jgi:hypothetical protein
MADDKKPLYELKKPLNETVKSNGTVLHAGANFSFAAAPEGRPGDFSMRVWDEVTKYPYTGYDNEVANRRFDAGPEHSSREVMVEPAGFFKDAKYETKYSEKLDTFRSSYDVYAKGHDRITYVLETSYTSGKTVGKMSVGDKEYTLTPEKAALEIRKGLEAVLDQHEKAIREPMIARGDQLPEQLKAFLPKGMSDLRDLPGGYGDMPTSSNAPAKPAAAKPKGK